MTPNQLSHSDQSYAHHFLCELEEVSGEIEVSGIRTLGEKLVRKAEEQTDQRRVILPRSTDRLT